MVRKCCIRGCGSKETTGSRIMFHNFPKEEMLRASWINNIKVLHNQNVILLTEKRICAEHFSVKDYVTRTNGRKCLKRGSEPVFFSQSDRMYRNYEVLIDEEKMVASDTEEQISCIDRIYPEGDTSSIECNMEIEQIYVNAEPPVASHVQNNLQYLEDINVGKVSQLQTTRRELLLCKNKVKEQNRKIIKLNRRLRYQTSKNADLKQLLNNVKDKYGISDYATNSTENSFADNILKQLHEGKNTHSYSDDVKTFSLTVNMYSTAAYNYIRDTFNKHLPCVETLRSIL